MIITTLCDAPCGQLTLGSIGDSLCLCDWNVSHRREIIDPRLCREFETSMTMGDSKVLSDAKKQLDEYFAGQRQHFDIPLLFQGSDFRHDVWSEIAKLPYGRTISYKDFAILINRPSSIRAVATAIGANPLSIFIPCHRIVGKDGKLTGYAGGIDAKRYLLDLEGALNTGNHKV